LKQLISKTRVSGIPPDSIYNIKQIIGQSSCLSEVSLEK